MEMGSALPVAATMAQFGIARQVATGSVFASSLTQALSNSTVAVQWAGTEQGDEKIGCC
jgi:hypothetical protein